ncbi:MAG TPA: hypothetical protein VFW78_04245 [Bacteroidia bacterium]|nr:hypothetical protein [Bacteroidia bacterium]
MKKFAAILLLVTYLFSATNFKELLKVNVVIQHFHETKQIEQSVSLFQFLVMHYITDDHNKKDDDRDKQLPFKAPDSCISNSSFVSIVGQFSVTSILPVSDLVMDLFPDTVYFVLTSFHALVWHPPQLS